MKKILIYILFLVGLLFITSCKENTPSQPLFQEIDEILADTDYYCYELQAEVFNENLAQNGLDKKYVVDDAIGIGAGSYYRYLNIYRLKKGNAQNLKKYLVENTLSEHLFFAAKDNLLFTGYPEDAPQELLSLFDIQIEEGSYNKTYTMSESIDFEVNVVGISEDKVLKKDFDVQIFTSYSDYVKIKTSIPFMDIYYEEKRLISEETFKNQNVVFCQFFNRIKTETPVAFDFFNFHKKGNTLEILIHYARFPYAMSIPEGYECYFMSIDKAIDVNKLTLSFFQEFTGVKGFIDEI